jgi:type IV secretion system protein VirB9
MRPFFLACAVAGATAYAAAGELNLPEPPKPPVMGEPAGPELVDHQTTNSGAATANNTGAISSAAATGSTSAAAASPAIDYDKFYAPDPALTPTELSGVAISDDWQNAGGVSMAVEGAVTFAFGMERPSVVCAVLQVTDIQLQAGETVQSVIVGDTLRWRVDAIKSGTDTPHIVVKPLNSGLETSMIVATDRRTYHFALKSTRQTYMSRVAFTYPNEIAAELARQKKEADAKKQAERERNTIPATNEYLGNLDFNYRVRGKANWKPVRVYNDGQKTLIDMPKIMDATEAPALLVKQNGEQTLVNYRVQGDRYVVDAIFKEAILIAGHGRKQQKVTITYLDYGKVNQ